MSTPVVASLSERLARIEDTRKRGGRRHPLPAILNFVAVALLAGCRSLDAIAQFGRDRGESFARALGFTRRKTPCKSTLSVVLRRLDVGRLEEEIAAWGRDRSAAAPGSPVALDGKTLRGSRDGEIPGVHLLAAYDVDSGAVLAQLRVDAKTNEHKAALQMLGVLPVEGRTVTADAMFTHRDFAQAVRDAGGDDILTAKDNQPTLKKDIAAAFGPPPAGFSPPADGAVGGRPAVGANL